MKVAIYVRVSTEDQANEGFSIDAQINKLKQYIELHDEEFRGSEVEVYSDPGYSGKNLDRPAIKKLIGEVNEEIISHILVWRLDRLSRNLKDILELSSLFQKKEVTLISFSEKFDTSTASGRLFFNITGVFAQFFREQLGENTKNGMSQRAKAGLWNPPAPTGYDFINGELILNSDAPRVKRAYELYSTGIYSIAMVAKEVDINRGTLGGLLKNRVYLGEVRDGEGNWYPGLHQALLEEDLFYKVQEIRKPYQANWKNRAYHPFSGFVRCGYCGRVMSMHRASHSFPQFACKHRNDYCKENFFKSSRITEEAFIFSLELMKKDKELLKEIKKVLREDRDSFLKIKNRELTTIDKQLRKLDSKKEKLVNLYYAEAISVGEFKSENNKLNKSKDILIKDKENIINLLKEKKIALKDFKEFIAVFKQCSMDKLWSKAKAEEKRELLGSYVENLLLFREKLEVKFLSTPPFTIWFDKKPLSIKRGGDRIRTGA